MNRRKRFHSQGLDQLGALGIRPFSSGLKLKNLAGENGASNRPRTIANRVNISNGQRKNKPTITLAKLNLPDLPSE